MTSIRKPLPASYLLASVLIAGTIGAIRSARAPAAEARPAPAAIDEELVQIFTAVAEGVRYEPYRGAARGGAATAVMLSGNSFDQSLLLADRLRGAGYQVRFARGTLGADNLQVLLRGMYPPRVTGTRVEEELAPFAPEADPELRRAAEDHVWVEVFQGEGWLPLDPSFPRAVVGASYAPVRDTAAALADDDYQTLTLVLNQEDARGRHQELARTTGRVADLAFAPITLVARSVPVSAARNPEAGGSPSRSMGMFGEAMTGEDPEEGEEDRSPEEVVGTRLARTLDAGGTVAELPPTIILDEGGEAPRREWLTIETRVPGEPVRTVERELARSNAPLSAYRRHTITVLNGPVGVGRVTDVQGQGPGLTRLDARSEEIRAAARLPVGDPSAAATARRIGRMGDVAGAVSGHLLNLLFARDSDALAARLAERSGAVLTWPRPRVLISSLTIPEPAGHPASLSLDLRINDVGIHPHPGLPSRLGPLLQTARGLQDAALEGALVARVGDGGRPLSAGSVIDAAVRTGEDLRVLRRGADLDRLGLPLELRRQIEPTLEAGYDVIIPGQAVEVDARPRWAWLRIQPEQGGLVAVMDGGEHQGMTQYTASGSSIGLNDKMGLAIGAIVGATSTEFAVAAGILKYGGATDEMVQEVEQYVESLLCNSCRSGAGAAASVEAGGAGASLGCFELEKTGTVEAGAKVSVPFCESYRKGFECSSGLVLGGLKGESLMSADAGLSGPAWSPPAISLGCR